MRSCKWFIVALCAALFSPLAGGANAAGPEGELRVMAWNIWHGGREDGEEVGPQRVVDVIRESGADLVAMQETYGSGERISEELGFHFHPRGTNVSIHSRYPVVEDISVFEEFKCVGAIVELPDGNRLAFYSIWLPYGGEIWAAGKRDTEDLDAMLAACEPSASDLQVIRGAIEKRLSGEQYEGIPVIIAGDFNSMSHLDYTAVARDQFQAVVDWPTSHVLIDSGFRDSYRECNPVVNRQADRTWTPRFPEQERDRIDFVYYKGDALRAVESTVLESHDEGFPSDHAAVLTEFELIDEAPTNDEELRIVSYNIRRGNGVDGEDNLERTAKVLERLQPDFVGLQEVDNGAARSGGVNQAAELGKMLDMHAAFGAFMEFQGGRYGMGVLSRHPMTNVRSVKLPDGNEPRIALAVDARLPGGDVVTVVNVHFDWVRDDSFRFAQAEALAQYLDELATPYILLGDFNDGPASRTLKMFQDRAIEAAKPRDDHYTFSSTNPRREIDFIFTSPKEYWTTGEVDVIDEPVASDHRPVLAIIRYSKP